MDLSEFGKSLAWYANRKFLVAGQYFETAKSMVVTVLKMRRGTYQKSFLHVGMVMLTVTAVISAPIIVNQYPTNATGSVLSAVTPVISVDTSDTQTTESAKPRRDVEEYTVKMGDTISSIAKAYGVDTDSINYLNDFPGNKILKPGDVIKIPPVSGIIVTVKKGDTIATLAKKYGLPSPQPIVDWPYNSFANDETFALTAGQTLVIPGGKPPAIIPIAPRIVSTPGIFAGGTGQFAWPTSGVITQYYSWYHSADDIAAPIGTQIIAADTGRVVSVQYLNYGYGYHVIIDHGNGYKTLYGHMSRIDVAEGQNVNRGQQIGLMGSTGRSTGSHLHFEILNGNARVNPLSLLK